MFLLKATARRDTVAGFIAHTRQLVGDTFPPINAPNAPRDFFIFSYFILHFISFRFQLFADYFSRRVARSLGGVVCF